MKFIPQISKLPHYQIMTAITKKNDITILSSIFYQSYPNAYYKKFDLRFYAFKRLNC